jgi:transcriptional regulator
MNRRDVLSSLAITACTLEAQDAASAPAASLYIPKAHLVEDRKFLHDFMEEFAFVDLISISPSLRVTHIPVLLDRSAGQFGTIRGHISKQNEQTNAFNRNHEALIIFRGPHRYISPKWYQTRQAVPTWNFAVVHASGKLSPVTDPNALRAFLDRLIHKFETYEGTDFELSKLPESYVNGMLSGIVGFEMQIERLEGKFKLGQERTPGDRQGILEHLEKATHERSLYDLTRTFYQRNAG